jgi:hypothetical protein
MTDQDIFVSYVTDRDIFVSYVTDRDIFVSYVTDRDIFVSYVTDRDIFVSYVTDRDIFVSYVTKPCATAVRSVAEQKLTSFWFQDKVEMVQVCYNTWHLGKEANLSLFIY